MIRLISFSILLLTSVALAEFKIPPLDAPVVDTAQLLSANERNQLSDLIRNYRERGGPQVGVLLMPSLEGLTIEEASIKVADAWKLGSAKGDEGLLILISRDERAVRIEVGQGLEGELPDVRAKRIIEDIMIPQFRRGNFADGIAAGLAEAANIINKDVPFGAGGKRSRARYSDELPRFPPLVKFLFFLFLVFMFFKFPFLFIGIPGGGYHRGYGGGRSWGGSSGGWGGGGGGFSGGGASGRW